jgi:hypothetical protein
MFTVLEVKPLKARLFDSGLLLASLVVFAASPALAQSGKTGDRVMIPTLQSADKELGVQAAEAIRSQLTKQTNIRDLVVVPKADINNSLQSSGYPPTEALAPGDAKALASLVRAPQYIDGTVSKTPTGFKIDSRLIISRDMTRAQVLPSAQAPKLDDAASQVAKSIQAARKQLSGEETCHNAVAQGKFQEGVNAARAAMASYPNANIAGACLVDAYAALKMDDSVIAVSERIRASDPANNVALRRLADTYRTKGDITKELEVLSQLAHPTPPTSSSFRTSSPRWPRRDAPTWPCH